MYTKNSLLGFWICLKNLPDLYLALLKTDQKVLYTREVLLNAFPALQSSPNFPSSFLFHMSTAHRKQNSAQNIMAFQKYSYLDVCHIEIFYFLMGLQGGL